MDVLRIAAFSQGNQGGNPAGVLIADRLPSPQDMQKIAKDVGFSERKASCLRPACNRHRRASVPPMMRKWNRRWHCSVSNRMIWHPVRHRP